MNCKLLVIGLILVLLLLIPTVFSVTVSVTPGAPVVAPGPVVCPVAPVVPAPVVPTVRQFTLFGSPTVQTGENNMANINKNSGTIEQRIKNPNRVEGGKKAAATRKANAAKGKTKPKPNAKTKKPTSGGKKKLFGGLRPKYAKAAKGLILFQILVEAFNYAHVNLTDDYERIMPVVSTTAIGDVKAKPVYEINVPNVGVLDFDKFYVGSYSNYNMFARKNFLDERLDGALEGLKNISIYNSFSEQVAALAAEQEVVSGVDYGIYEEGGEEVLKEGNCVPTEKGFSCATLEGDIDSLGLGNYELLMFIDTNPMLLGAEIELANSSLIQQKCNYINLEGSDFCGEFIAMEPTEAELYAEIDAAKEEVLGDASFWKTTGDSLKSAWEGQSNEFEELYKIWEETPRNLRDWDDGPWYKRWGMKTLECAYTGTATAKALANGLLFSITAPFSVAETFGVRAWAGHLFEEYKTHKYASKAMVTGLPILIKFEKSEFGAEQDLHVIKITNINNDAILEADARDFIFLTKETEEPVAAEVKFYLDSKAIEVKVLGTEEFTEGEKLILSLMFSTIDSEVEDQIWELTYHKGAMFDVRVVEN